MRHGRQKRTVRFGEEPVERHGSDHVAELDRFWKGDDAGQRNVEAEIEPGARERRIAREAVQNALHRSAAVLAEDRNRILIRFARVNHDGTLQFARETNLTAEDLLLHIAKRIKIRLRSSARTAAER